MKVLKCACGKINCKKKIQICSDEYIAKDLVEIMVANEDGIYPVNCGIHINKNVLLEAVMEVCEE